MTARIHNIHDDGIWRGRRSWTITMEDEHGRSQVSAYGDTLGEALADARSTFANRRRFTPKERAALARSQAELNKLFEPES